jgi:WD40-like Beta Propeller Repeat
MTRCSISVLLVSILAGCTSTASSPSGLSSATPPTASGLSRVYESGGTIFVVGQDGSPVALTRGYLPKLSPDGTTIAFLRDPADPHYEGAGDPFVLQVWLIHPDDGSGLRKLGQQRECCIGASAHLNWSPDGSSIVLNAIREQAWDVATGESLPTPSPTE